MRFIEDTMIRESQQRQGTWDCPSRWRTSSESVRTLGASCNERAQELGEDNIAT